MTDPFKFLNIFLGRNRLTDICLKRNLLMELGRYFVRICAIMLRLLMTMMLSTQTILAMPKYDSDNAELNALQAFARNQDPIIKGAQILGDDHADLLYISPSSKKAHAGAFQQLANPACHILKNHYDLTYLMPDVPVEDYAEFAKKGPFTPFFDTRVGNYVRYASIINRMTNKMDEISQLKSKNSKIVEEFEIARANFEQAQAEYNDADAAYGELIRKIQSLVDLLGHTNDDEKRARIREAIDEANRIMDQEGPKREERLSKAINEINRVRPIYVSTRAAYNAAIPNIEDLNEQVASLFKIFEHINNVAMSNFVANEKSLQDFESSTVGIAKASYSIWGDEESRLQNVLSSFNLERPYFRQYGAARLPIHNIRLKKPKGIEMSGAVSGSFLSGDTSTVITNMGSTSDGMLIGNVTKASKYPIFIKDDEQVTPAIQTLSGDGAGTYNNLVTRGSFCTGNSKRRSWMVESQFMVDESPIKSRFEVYSYQPRTTNILAQSVALEYDFYVRSKPIKVDCSLDVSRFRTFTATSGSSGILFWRKSWSSADRTRADNSGIVCQVNVSPSGDYPNYKEQNEYAQSIQQAMMQEIAAEYILTYAKSWEIYRYQPAVPDINPGKGAYKAGTALMALCGTNIYCAIGGIILKTGNELFGSHSHRDTNYDHLTGKIHRSYEENSWTTSSGQAVIDLTVNLADNV